MILEFFAEQLFFKNSIECFQKFILMKENISVFVENFKKSSGCGARTSKIET